MTLMRRLFCCKLLCCSYPTWWIKLLGTIFVSVLLFRIFQKHYDSRKQTLVLKRRIALDKEVYQKWQCDMNRQMLGKLQKELKEKNKLLNYRGKVIMSLRHKVFELNETNTRLNETILYLTRTVVYSTLTNLTESSNSFDQQQFDRVREGASKAARPCCMALNRMTNILREYMEATQELRDQVATLRLSKVTKSATVTPTVNKKVNSKSKGQRPEKYAVYQLFSKQFFYESIPLNRLEPKQKLKSKTFRRNHDFKYAADYAINEIAERHVLKKELFEIGDSIFRYDELNGAHYHFTFVYNKTQKIKSHVVKPYTQYMTSEIQFIKKEEDSSRKELINIVVSVSKRSDRLLMFLKNIHSIRKTHSENLFVTIVIYDTMDSGNNIKASIKNFSKKYNFTGYDILKRHLPFNRGRALHEGIMRWNGYSNVLLFVCDVDIKIKPEFFNRCRQFSNVGRSVYMPVIFSLYNPDIVFNGNKTLYTSEKAYNISESTGTWRPYGYGMVCMYKPDYTRIGGFNLQINGWGGEDYSLYMRILKKGLKIIRPPEPALLHIWHTKFCSPSLNIKQYDNCLGSKARYEASQRQLGILVFKANCTKNCRKIS